MMINTQKSILAKLLATENIEVIHGNFQTAFFDVEKRVLGLPLWTQLENVYDLLVGHEVGHALFTPPEGWHDADVEIPGIPRSFVNVVEDIRIEKLIQRKYPGLVASFKRGYKKLDEDDFFGASKYPAISPQYVNLIDRINLKAKLRDLIQVQFSADEQPLVDEAFAVETWQDVLDVCRKLYEWAKDNTIQSPSIPNIDNKMEASVNETIDPTAEQGEQNSSENSDMDDSQESGSQAMESGETSKEEDNQSAGDSVQPEGQSDTESKNDETDETTDEGVTKSVANGEGSKGTEITSETDDAFRSNEGKLIDHNHKGNATCVANGFTDKQIKEMVIPYHKIKKARQTDDYYESDNFKSSYENFLNDNKKVVQVMAKEFEMRKAAWRSKRTQTARSGTLDVNKLYAYKYTDDIFKRMALTPDAKNHGMFMMVDYSGSMHHIMRDVLKQVLVLTMFCKKVNIPFQVWGFTSANVNSEPQRSKAPHAHVDHKDTRLYQLLSSTFNKTEFEIAFKALYRTSFYAYYHHYLAFSEVEKMGGTPLDEMLIAAPTLVESFTKQNNIQKTNFILLTDGYGSRIDVARHENEFCNSYGHGGYSININGRLVTTKDKGITLTTALLENLKKQCNSVTGYFLAGNRGDFNSAMRGSNANHNEFYKIRSEFLKNKFVSFDNHDGYDRFFILRCDGRSADTETTGFDVKENAKKGDIARAFKKHANSKKANRTLAVKFAEMVA